MKNSSTNRNLGKFEYPDSSGKEILVDVVMPFFNGGDYFSEQLESILGQTLGGIRLTILDNGSDPKHSKVLLENTKGLRNVRVVRSEENHGVVRGVELLLMKTGAPYVALSDQDDVWDHDKLEISLNALRDGSYDLVYSDLRLIDACGGIIAESHWKNTRCRPLCGQSALPFVLKNPVAGCTIIARAEMIHKALPFPAEIPMHDRWLAIVAAQGDGVGFVDRATISYRQHGSNDTGSLRFGFSTLKKRFSRGGGGLSGYLKRRRRGQAVLLEHISRTSKNPLESKLARFLSFYCGLGRLGSVVCILPYVLASLIAGRGLGVGNVLVDILLGVSAGLTGRHGQLQHITRNDADHEK